MLERRADELAASLLEPLSAAQRARLVAAMGDVERLLTAAIVDIAPVDPLHPDAQHCLTRSTSPSSIARFETGFDPQLSIPADADQLRPPSGVLLLASLRSEPIGCGALKFRDEQPTEIKRMWVAESARGLGIGRRLLQELEARAAQHGSRIVRLETNQTLTEAVAMYRSAGYVEVEAFNDEPYAHHWFEKHLATPG